MATTVTASTLTVTITENLTLRSQNYGSTTVKTFSSIKEIIKRIVRCEANQDTTIAAFNTGKHSADGSIDLEDVKYIRLTNLDSVFTLNLSLQVAGGEGGTANMSSSHLLSAGESFLLHTIHDGIALSDAGATVVSSLNDLESIIVEPPVTGESIDVELFIASV